MGQVLKKDEPFEDDFEDESIGELTLASAQECTDFFKKDSTSTSINREDELEISSEDLNTDGLTIDHEKEFLKDALKDSKASIAPKIVKSDDDLNIDKENEHLKEIQNNKVIGTIKTAGGKKAIEDAVFENIKGYESLVDEIGKDPLFTNKGDEYPQINGNYFLLDHLVDGGMAKICRARYLGDSSSGGADKLVVLKMVQEKFSNDPEYAAMFLDEIKVSFGLQHPNISTTFDYGKIGSNLFVSMEYIHGKDLKMLVDKLAAKKQVLPFEITLYIISKMCEGLFYAHNFSNQLTGQSYNIVHRDISPHNVMVSFDGYVKVIDFGIAKADTNEQIEQEGTVKGKINYFAPEYLEGKSIDHRYDQFAIGLTFWELLTGKKTFDEKDQLKTIKAIFDCHPRKPSVLNSKIPKEIEAIVMKTLSRDPKDRYKDLSELNRAITALIHKLAPGLNQQDLSHFMKQMWIQDFENDMKTFLKFGEYKLEEIKEKIQQYKDYQEKLKSEGAEKGDFLNLDLGFVSLETSLVDKNQGDNSSKSKKKKKDSLQKALMGMVEEANKSAKTTNRGQSKKPKKNIEGILISVSAVIFFAIYNKSLILNLLKPKPVVVETFEEKVLDDKIIEPAKDSPPKNDTKDLPSLPVLTFSLKTYETAASLELEQNDIYKTVQLMNGLKNVANTTKPVAANTNEENNVSRSTSSIQDSEKAKLIEEMNGKLKIKEVILKEAVEEHESPITNWIRNRKIYKLFFE
ncbi:MAG: hypothetical protein COW01_11615 [Bdellovibrionales bacterium CG12_big_fil_rev_8_21_14_0_65_38_15]|nr:MAG: hypothetical protein COW79_11645 [Bdellovibrionales bacterium CG22_combo_CG10-13_8_21_14_all_38_13]PIQ54259.1 MAG: hypothetical protein COW01_11615 [Bdellovibrionales bacterium CG12_big_fil_rev_8_21_14_0_65_38_15]PIR29315.1 MAG: hypothetical protein COV38_11260 [Bdellovibrionales bacterium CG11_big_fil_rev_8_21_14_0_20_38_13]